MNSSITKKSTALWLVLLIAVVAAVYSPGLNGPYIFDDYPNILFNKPVQVEELSLSTMREVVTQRGPGASYRPLAWLSFALNHYLADGFDKTWHFKLFNLTVHIINALLVFFLALWLLGKLKLSLLKPQAASWLAFFIAGLWALSPIQLTSVHYVVQRMTSMSALFVLAGLMAFLWGRDKLSQRPAAGFAVMLCAIIAGTLLGFLSKENAVLLSLFALLLELVFYDRSTLRADTRRYLYIFYGVLLLPFVIGLLWLLASPEIIMSAYERRDFGLYERVLSQPRALWFYLGLLLFPFYKRFGLFHDDFVVSTGLLSPLTTALCIIGLAILVVVSVVRFRQWKLLAFAVFWFLIGHALESTVIALEMVHEHRNYLPLFGPVFALGVVLYGILSRSIQPKYTVLALVSLMLIVSANTVMRSLQWGDKGALTAALVRHHPNSPRSHVALAEYYAQNQNRFSLAVVHYLTAMNQQSVNTVYLMRLFHSAAQIKTWQKNSQAVRSFIQQASFVDNGKRQRVFAVKRHRGQIRVFPGRAAIGFVDARVARGRVGYRTYLVLYELVECIRLDQGCAIIMPETRRWLLTALKNPSLTDNLLRRDMIVVLVRLLIHTREYTLAMQYTREARSQLPDDLHIMLMQAELHYRMGQKKASRELVEDIESKTAASSKSIKQQLQNLRKLLAQ